MIEILFEKETIYKKNIFNYWIRGACLLSLDKDVTTSMFPVK